MKDEGYGKCILPFFHPSSFILPPFLLRSHPENHLRAVRKKPCFGGAAPGAVFASASNAVKNCDDIILAVPWIIRCPTLAIVPPSCRSPVYLISVPSP